MPIALLSAMQATLAASCMLPWLSARLLRVLAEAKDSPEPISQALSLRLFLRRAILAPSCRENMIKVEHLTEVCDRLFQQQIPCGLRIRDLRGGFHFRLSVHLSEQTALYGRTRASERVFHSDEGNNVAVLGDATQTRAWVQFHSQLS